MRIVAGKKGTKVYRRDRHGVKKLTFVPPGEPVPEFKTMTPHGLARAERRGHIEIDWQGDDELRAAIEGGGAPKHLPVALTPEEPPPDLAIETPGEQEPAEAEAEAADVEEVEVEAVVFQTARGLTEHLSFDGEKTLCGRTIAEATVTAGTGDPCSRCAKAASEAA